MLKSHQNHSPNWKTKKGVKRTLFTDYDPLTHRKSCKIVFFRHYCWNLKEKLEKISKLVIQEISNIWLTLIETNFPNSWSRWSYYLVSCTMHTYYAATELYVQPQSFTTLQSINDCSQHCTHRYVWACVFVICHLFQNSFHKPRTHEHYLARGEEGAF